MSTDLRSSLIRLAHERPELRADLLPLLKEAAPIDQRAVLNTLDGCLGKMSEVEESLKALHTTLALADSALDKAVDRAAGEAQALHGRLEQLRSVVVRDGVRGY